MMLARVLLGRVKDEISHHGINHVRFHSELKNDRGTMLYSIKDSFQVFPEYTITYFIDHGRAPTSVDALESLLANATISTPVATTDTNTKVCIICCSMPVTRVFKPCGHCILCEDCLTEHGLKSLDHKCPECRSEITECNRFYY